MIISRKKPKLAKRTIKPPCGIKRAAKAAHSTKTNTLRPKPKAAAQAVSVQPGGGSLTKRYAVLSLLRQPKGTTVTSIMKVTGWQKHSVRGFFAGVIKKKLKLNLLSDKLDGQRVYRIGSTTRAL